MSAVDRIRALLPGSSSLPWHAYPEPSGPDAGTWLNNGEVGMREHGVAVFPAEMNEQGPVDAALVKTLVNNAEALCDLVEDVRAAIDHYDHCVACDDHTDNCRCDMADVRATLARLDREDGS